MYHRVPRRRRDYYIDAEIFERQMRLLQERFDLIGPDRLHDRRPRTARVRVLVTFDDGFRNNLEVAAPTLRRLGIPAVFFVCTRHTAPGTYLWWTYLEALRKYFDGEGYEFRGEWCDMSPSQRAPTVDRLETRLHGLQPYPRAMYEAIAHELPTLEDFVDEDTLADQYAGLTDEQVSELAADPLFAVGVHTLDHPYLTRCSDEEAARQLRENKEWIEEVTGQPCRLVSYPLGDYGERELDLSAKMGFDTGFAVMPRLRKNPRLEVPRVGIYAPSLNFLGFKVAYGRLVPRLQAMGRRSDTAHCDTNRS